MRTSDMKREMMQEKVQAKEKIQPNRKIRKKAKTLV